MITKVFIKMCEKSPQVQKLWEPKYGDRFMFENEIGMIYILDRGRIPDKESVKKYKIKTFLIPTPEQLQKMSGLPWWEFDEECNTIRRCLLEDPLSETEVNTKQEAAICVVMRGYGKFWNGEDWVSSKEL